MSETNIQRLVLISFCFSGAAALIYEVAWTRALSFILGSTVYSLSILLATFMAGLALGAYLGGKIADRRRNLLLYFGLFELGIGLFGIMTVPVIYRLPGLYFWIYKSFHINVQVYYILQFLLCAAIMLVPTTFMGATFPVVSKRVTAGMEEMGRKVGDAYSANTVGAIIGSLSAGFLLIPLVGIKWAAFVAGITNLSVALVILNLAQSSKIRMVTAVCLVTVGLGATVVSTSDMKNPSATFYQANRFKEFHDIEAVDDKLEVVFSRDYAEGHVIAYREAEFLTLQIDGKPEGTTFKELPNTMMLAGLPAATFSDKPGDALLIGLGSGMTLWAGKHMASTMEVVEVNPGVVEAVDRFGFPDVLSDTTVSVTDGRRYLLYNDTRYDMILSGISVPSESMAANLFTKEFYELAASRLNIGGVFSQHLPAFILTKQDARAAFKTFASVFAHANVWFVPSSQDFIMIGSNEPFGIDTDELSERALHMVLSVLQTEWEEEMMAGEQQVRDRFGVRLVRDAVRMREVLDMEDVRVITDDRPYIEFAITKNLLLGPDFRKFRD